MPAQIAARHTRVQKWDQTGATNTRRCATAYSHRAGPIPIEDGIEVEFSTVPAGGSFRVGDYWVIWARTATARIDEFTDCAAARHRAPLCAARGDQRARRRRSARITDCRPPPQQASDCCCTIIVRPGENIQAGIDALPAQGGCVCLKTGLHVIQEPLAHRPRQHRAQGREPRNDRALARQRALLIIGNPAGFRIEGIDVLGIDFEANGRRPRCDGVVMIVGAERVRVSHCGMSGNAALGFVGSMPSPPTG